MYQYKHDQPIEVPERMRKLPLYKGLPIPYATYIGEDGLPDFKVVDEKKRRICMQSNRCGLCGEKLDPVIVFIGGNRSVTKRTFLDPGMHEKCALYATKVCPYLANPNHDYSSRDPKHLKERQTVIKVFEEMHPHRPVRLALYYCRGFDMIMINGSWHSKAKKSFKIDWDTIPRRDTEGDKDAEN